MKSKKLNGIDALCWARGLSAAIVVRARCNQVGSDLGLHRQSPLHSEIDARLWPAGLVSSTGAISKGGVA